EPEGRLIVRMIRGLLTRCEAAATEIDYVNAHGTSTVPNDRIETRVLKEVFGSHAGTLAVSSTKSMTGHAVGASGAIEAAATALTLVSGVIAPTINLENPDPECDLDYVPNVARRRLVRTAITTSYGFGGHNGALLLRKV